MDSIFIIGVFLSFFLQFLLLSKKQKTLSDKILAVWMFILGVHLFSYYIYYLGYWEKFPHLVGITHPFPLLHGPMLFLYVVFSIRADQHFRWKDYLHFAPFVFSYLYMINFFFFYPASRKILIDKGEVNDFELFMNISLPAFILSGLLYPVFSYRLIGKHKKLINQNFSFEESINLNWLKLCIWYIAAIYLSVGLIVILENGLGIEFNFNTDIITYFLVVLFVLSLGYFGIKQQGIFTQNLASEQFVETKSTAEYKKSGLKQNEAEIFHQKLLKLMKEKKPYLEPKLTLNTLAGELNISINHLSQIINQYQSKNFYDFINEYRVTEFKERITDKANRSFSILAIAYDSGFNSKSAFNHVFKKITGKTPTQFMNEVNA